MKKIYSPIALLILILTASATTAQTIFWTEKFRTGCNTGQMANGVVPPTNMDGNPHRHQRCAGQRMVYQRHRERRRRRQLRLAVRHKQKLHVGANDGFAHRPRAAYDAGGLCTIICVSTDARAESPAINCTGRTAITLSFNYIEYGDGALDDCTLWYYDGATWAQIDPLAKTPCCGGVCNGNRQGQWTAFSIALPVSANNNANVKIGFRWVNNDDGTGTDPSFAVDDIQLTVASTVPHAAFSSSDSVFCAEPPTCINFTDHSTGNPTSWHWSFPGAVPSSSTAQNPDSICYPTAGTFPVTLIVGNTGGSDTLTVSPMITAGQTPPLPIITVSNDTIYCSPAYSYRWYITDRLFRGY